MNFMMNGLKKNNMIPENISTGAYPSKKDKRNIKFSDMAVGDFLIEGGYHYLPNQVEHQHGVGICTAISRVQLRQAQTGKKYSPDFQYLLQKKYYDGWGYEGSSVLTANKVAKNYGFLPIEHFNQHITEKDRFLSYAQYAQKLQAIPDNEVKRLLTLCVDKIAGYAQVNVKDSQSMAKAIKDSNMGILCRYGCQSNWWTDIKGKFSWNAKDIEPLRWKPETSGHAIINSYFNYGYGTNMQELCNTWGTLWAREGKCNIDFDEYPPTEAFIDLPFNPMFQFTKDLKYGMRNNDVKELQKRLGVIQTSFFGLLTLSAVKKYQTSKGLVADGIVGPLTRIVLNR